MVTLDGQTLATGPLLEIKLYAPRWRPGLVRRQRLMERLDQAVECKLMLVSAPAGFGKTTLLAEWLKAGTSEERPAAWVSLSQSESDPTLFWSYVISALRKVHGGVGESALSWIQSPQPPPIEAVLGTLLNEIGTIADGSVLVLDDYHLIDSQAVHDGVALLLDHLPPQMQLVIVSRADPPLPLSRLRGRGELAELRAADLRFRADEAAGFLNEVMDLELSAEDVGALEARTEGWIAGLQLAALSMQGRDDVAGFIAAFTGDDRYIVDYLVDEVLERQSEPVRSFLLQTSILDRLSGALCDAVTGEPGGKGMLEALERGDLFVVPLDDQRRWYRYHHLFADVLHAYSMDEEPERIPLLHRRASEWYKQNGQHADAIRHALAGEDFERAASLIELAWRPMERRRQSARWLEWAKALPDALVLARPVLSVAFARALMDGGELEAGEARLRDAERWLDAPADAGERPGVRAPEMVVVDEEEFLPLRATIAAARAFHAQAVGDVPGTLTHAQRALDLLPDGDQLRRGSPAALLGIAYWNKGDLEAADRSLSDAMVRAQAAGDGQFAITATYVLAQIRMGRGQLDGALKACEQALQLAADQGEAALRGTADVHTGLSELRREQGDLGAAAEHLLTSKQLGEQTPLPHAPYRWSVAQARLRASQGELDGALTLLDEAERRYVRGPVPDTRPVAALRTQMWVTQGRLADARDWARDRKLSVDDELSYLREFEHVTLVRMLIAGYRHQGGDGSIRDAVGLLERLLQAAERGERTGSVIEILVLQALAQEARGEIAAGLPALERALSLGEPEGYVRIFVDEGETMRDLLRHAVTAGISGAYARRVLAGFDERVQSVSTAMEVAATPLVEPLTVREVEILRLVAAGMRNQEIADHLFIRLPTVKRHIANAYGKLGVGHRTAAVARANELSLL